MLIWDAKLLIWAPKPIFRRHKLNWLTKRLLGPKMTIGLLNKKNPDELGKDK